MCCSVLGQRHRGYNLVFRVGGYVIGVHQGWGLREIFFEMRFKIQRSALVHFLSWSNAWGCSTLKNQNSETKRQHLSDGSVLVLEQRLRLQHTQKPKLRNQKTTSGWWFSSCPGATPEAAAHSIVHSTTFVLVLMIMRGPNKWLLSDWSRSTENCQKTGRSQRRPTKPQALVSDSKWKGLTSMAASVCDRPISIWKNTRMWPNSSVWLMCRRIAETADIMWASSLKLCYTRLLVMKGCIE